MRPHHERFAPAGPVEQSLHRIALARAGESSAIRSEWMRAARIATGDERSVCVRLARQANYATIHSLRTARESLCAVRSDAWSTCA